MADNIQFLRGEQSKLNTLTTFTEGAFYLTTDTDRLYYAKTSSDLAYLNKYITTVANVDALMALDTKKLNVGDFYYVTSGNILCFYNGGSEENPADSLSKWTQVNAQTVDTDTKVGSFTIAETTADNTGITFTYNLSQVDKAGGKVGTDISDTFKIEKADINALVDHPVIKVGLSATAITNGAKISTTGNGNDSDEFVNIKGGSNVTVAVNGDDITISAKDAPEYDMTKGANDDGSTVPGFKLTKDGEEIGQLGFVNYDSDGVEDEGVTIYSDENNIIHITHDRYGKNPSRITDQTVDNGDEITILKDVTVSNGHVTGVTTATVKLELTDTNTDTIVDAIGVNKDDASKIEIALVDKVGEDAGTVTSGSILYYEFNNKTFANQSDLTEAISDFVDGKIDNVLTSANAMTFKGGISNNTLPTSASIGDTYIITTGSVTTDDGEIATAGDILIAYSSDGTETDGIIDSGKLKWTVVPGEEKDTTYTLTSSKEQITLTPSDADGDATKSDKIGLSGDDVITVDGSNNTLQVTHKDTYSTHAINSEGASKSLSHNGTFKAITGFTNDKYGHITGISETTFTLPELPDHKHIIDGDTTNKKAILKTANGDARGSIQMANGTAISIDCTNTDNDNGDNVKFTVNHTNITRNDSNATTSTELGNGNEFIVVSGVNSNGQGHITGITTQKYKLVDQNTKYELSGAIGAVNNGVSITDTLKEQSSGVIAGTSAFNLVSTNPTNLQVSKDDNATTVQLSLVWGSF